MSTVQKQGINTQVGQNAQLFPFVVTSEQQSLNYMKRLTAVAISNILYLRNVFTEDCYGHRKLDHLKLRILTERTETVGAKQVVQWVKGCFDAMEKKYLKQLTLGIYTDPENRDELIEAYTFRFTYDSNKCNFNVSLNQKKNESQISGQSTTTELRTATVQLLRSLILMTQSLDKLPDDCYITMKLLYYDDITPADYEPPGFIASDTASFTFKGQPISISAGVVDTRFHTFKLKIRTNQEQFQDMAPSHSSGGIQAQEIEDQCSPLEIDDNSENIEFQPLTQKRNKSAKVVNPQTSVTPIGQNKSGLGNGKQKSTESKVISKLEDLKMDDKKETNKRKHDFEVTQDSMFSPNADKRVKASKVDKEVPNKG